MTPYPSLGIEKRAQLNKNPAVGIKFQGSMKACPISRADP
jgi:hypothetical protein